MKSLSLVLAPTLFLASCASIVSKSTYPVTVTSNPSGCLVAVKNSEGETIHQGTTPTTLTLKSSAGYFRPAHYTFEFTKKGGAKQTIPVSATMNGWYIGNIVFGGLIGLVVVDPLTGAMWKLDEKVTADFAPIATLDNGNGHQLSIVDRATLPASVQKQLVSLR